jgi:hypothetical protein
MISYTIGDIDECIAFRKLLGNLLATSFVVDRCNDTHEKGI